MKGLKSIVNLKSGQSSFDSAFSHAILNKKLSEQEARLPDQDAFVRATTNFFFFIPLLFGQ
jgi:hypothetical protein